jgi:molecular chaperone GrpE
MSESDNTPNGPSPEPERVSVGDAPEASGVYVNIAAEEYEALQRAARERDELRERVQRAAADYQNLQNRSRRRQQEAAEMGINKLARELLPVIDNLNLALQATGESDDVEKLRHGLEIIHEQLENILSEFEIRPVQAVGQPFDPEVHDAMAQEPSDEHPPNTVLREFQRGYIHGDRVLRPARVIVARPGDQSPDTGREDD